MGRTNIDNILEPFPVLHDRIAKAWDEHTFRVQWMDLERTIRDTFKIPASDTEKLDIIKEALAAYTRRG